MLGSAVLIQNACVLLVYRLPAPRGQPVCMFCLLHSLVHCAAVYHKMFVAFVLTRSSACAAWCVSASLFASNISPAVLVPALRTVGNIVTGNDIQTQVIINCHALAALLQLLTNNHKKSIKKEACWTISNITAGTKEQIQSVIDSGIIPPLIYLMQHAEFDIKKEAAWAISNATSGGTADQIRYLVSAGAIKPLCDLLTVQDVRIVTVALEGLENILKVGAPRSTGRACR